MSMSTTILSDGAPDRYVDRKRYLWVLSVVWPAAPLIGLYLVHLTGWSIFYAFTLFVWYGAIPVFDVLFGKDPNNPPEAAVARLEADRYYRVLTWLTVPVHYASLIGCAWWITTRSEEHTSELQSLMRISYAVFCLKKKNNSKRHKTYLKTLR